MAANEEFASAEDLAIKQALTGLTVASLRGGTSNTTAVNVWFRWPEREFAGPYRDALFPFITIDLMNVVYEANRHHSYNYDEMQYIPDDTPTAATPQEYMAPFPIPVSMIYMVATHCRSARHDRELLRKLLQPDYLPYKFGSLYVPQDDTVRRLDVLNLTQNTDYDSLKKRVFRRIWTIGVSAEMLPENWSAPSPPINTPITEVDLAVIPTNF